jgi:hypothetical protein
LEISLNIFKQIPSKWRDLNRNLYIRVTLVTSSEHIPVVCIHPYAIDTHENDILRDPYHNSLYFPITKEEIRAGEKRYRKIFFSFKLIIDIFSFRISRKKMIQHDLRSYGPFRIFDLSEKYEEYIK